MKKKKRYRKREKHDSCDIRNTTTPKSKVKMKEMDRTPLVLTSGGGQSVGGKRMGQKGENQKVHQKLVVRVTEGKGRENEKEKKKRGDTVPIEEANLRKILSTFFEERKERILIVCREERERKKK